MSQKMRNVHVNPRPVRIPFAGLVRWRFDYTDHKPTKVGQWCRAGEQPVDMAAYQSKENLATASIEFKANLTGLTKVVAECAGHDFVNFSWVAGACVGAAITKIIGDKQLRGQIIGLTLVTRDMKCTVMIDGQPPKIEARTEAEKAFNYAGFGK